MDYKKIMLISVILLILSVTAVSADDFDNMTIQTSDVGTVESFDDVISQDSLQNGIVESTDESNALNASFNDLQLLIISTLEGTTANLTCDYTSNGYFVTINKNLIIDGNNHVLNGDGVNNIFRLGDSVSVTLKNITFKNGHGIEENFTDSRSDRYCNSLLL